MTKATLFQILINSVDDDGKLKVLNLFIQILKKPFRIKNLFKLSKIYKIYETIKINSFPVILTIMPSRYEFH